MSVSSAMYIGASGLSAQGEGIDVVGDNIANSNTIGFKENRAIFEDLMTQKTGLLNTVTVNEGLGVRMAGTQRLTTQGSLQSTGQANDLAIDGSGYFIVNGTRNGVTSNYYTRAGQFGIANDGYLVNQDGMRVQGYQASNTGVLGTNVGDLLVSGQTVPPLATKNASIVANLDSASTIPATFDPTNPQTTSNFSTSTTVYDSLGTARKIDVYFHNNGAGGWDWHALVDGSQVTGGTAGTAFEGATGTMTFNTDGSLASSTGNASSWNFLGATAAQAVNINLGTGTGAGGTGRDGITQFAGASNVTAQNQDGFAAGALEGYSIDNNGTISGSFSNGEKQTIGQLATASFAAEDKLGRMGSSLFQANRDSGEALVGAAQTGNHGRVVSGSLEQSNVDLGQQFVDMIAYERGYQASSKVIQTSDEMLQDLVQLKR